jgi:probable rRNA maturation factor
MSTEITILNKQRKISLNGAWLEATTEALFRAVLEELSHAPVPWLSRSNLSKFRGRGALTLVLVSDRQIKELNRKWRHKNYATDVLSFPLVVGDDRTIGLMDEDESEPIELGEIVISLEKALEQAAEYGHSFERELAFLFVHGFLHILGFDHITKQQEKEMFGRQSKILAKAGFDR